MFRRIAEDAVATPALNLAGRVLDVLLGGQLSQFSRPFTQWLTAEENALRLRHVLSLALDALCQSGFAISGPGAIDESLLCHEEFGSVLWAPLLDPKADREIDIDGLTRAYDEVVWKEVAPSFSEELRARQRDGLRFLVDALYDELLWYFPESAERLSHRILRELDAYVSPAKQEHVIRCYLKRMLIAVRAEQKAWMDGGEYVEPILQRLENPPTQEDGFRASSSKACDDEIDDVGGVVSVDIDNYLLTGTDHRSLIVADSGYGKSTLLAEVLARACGAWIPGGPVPFLFSPDEATACSEASLQAILARRLAVGATDGGTHSLHVRENQLRRIAGDLERRALLFLLFDALDQIEAPGGLLGYLKNAALDRNRIIVSTRPEAWARHRSVFSGYACVRIAEFDKKRQAAYFGPLLTSPVLRDTPAELLGIPILAMHMRRLLREESTSLDAIRNRSDLYKTVIYGLAFRDQDRQVLNERRPAEAIEDMRTLAFAMLMRNCLNSGFSHREAEQVLGHRRLADLERLQFVVRFLESGEKLFFRHKSIQEFLAGEVLEKMWTRGMEAGGLTSRYFLHPNWEQPLRFMAGLLQESRQVDSLVTLLLAADTDEVLAVTHENVRLACVCLHEARIDAPRASAETMAKIEPIWDEDPAEAIRLLAVWGRGDALGRLAQALEVGRRSSSGVWVAEALARIRSPEAAVLRALVAVMGRKDVRVAVAEAAARALADIGSGPPAVLEALVGALESRHPRVAAAAAWALGTIGSGESEVVESLIEATRRENRLAVRSAAWALGQVGSGQPCASKALISLIRDGDSEVATAAVLALGELGPNEPPALRALVAALKTERLAVVEAVARVLGDAGSVAPAVLEALIARLNSEGSSGACAAHKALARLAAHHPEVIEALLEALGSRTACAAKGIVRILGEIGQRRPAVVEALVAGLDHDDPEVASAAARALGHIGSRDEPVVERLIEAVNRGDSRVAASAAAALGEIGSGQPRIVEALAAVLGRADRVVAEAAIWALGEARSEDTSRALVATFGHGDPYVARTAIRAATLGGVRSESVLRALITSAHCSDSVVAEAAIEQLGESQSREPAVLGALIACVSADQPGVAGSAIVALGKIGAEQPGVTQALVAAARSGDAELAEYASWSLGRIRSQEPDAVAALLAAVGSGHGQVASAAALALGEIGSADEHVLEALVAASGSADPLTAIAAARALGKIEPREPAAAGTLLTAMKSLDQDVFDIAFEALEHLDPSGVLTAVLCALEDPSYAAIRSTLVIAARNADSKLRARSTITP